jgi:hypothetical protein
MLIDCDTNPLWPEHEHASDITTHKRDGQRMWMPEKVTLWTTSFMQGDEVRRAMEEKAVLNACVLNCLLVNQHLIPEGWRNKHIFFYGTMYLHADFGRVVRGLSWMPKARRFDGLQAEEDGWIDLWHRVSDDWSYPLFIAMDSR